MRDRKRGDGEDIVFFKPDRIGDFVLATGAISLFQNEYSNKKIKLVVSEQIKGLARQQFPDVEVIAIPHSGDSFGAGLLSNYHAAKLSLINVNPKILISLRYHPTLYQDLLLRVLTCAQSFGSSPTDIGGGYDLLRLRKFKPCRFISYPNKHHLPDRPQELEAHRRLAEVVLNRTVTLNEVMPRINGIKNGSNCSLLILPFGSDTIRNYPMKLLAEAIYAAKLPTDLEIRLCGERSQVNALTELAELLTMQDGLGKVQIVYPESIVCLVKEVAAASCVLTMESAGAHIATALDKSTVIIMGGGHFGAFGPWHKSSRQRWLFTQRDCFSCDWHCSYSGPLCITEITPQIVAKALYEICHAS